MSAKKQSKDKRACVDCHFVALRQLKWEGLSTPTDTEGPYELGVLQREQVRKKEDVTVKWDNLYKPDTKLVDSEHILACYQDVWDEFNENFTIKHRGMVDPKFRYRILVEEDRSNCIKFFMYTPSMSFEVAEEQRKAESLQSKQNSSEGNITDSGENNFPPVTPDSADAGKESILVDSVYKLLKYKEKEEKLEPLQIQLLRLLYMNRDSIVSRRYILDHIWNGSDVYEQQVTDHISRIKKAFKKLGYEKDIIETIIKSRVSEGGYIFKNNTVSLDFL